VWVITARPRGPFDQSSLAAAKQITTTRDGRDRDPPSEGSETHNQLYDYVANTASALLVDEGGT